MWAGYYFERYFELRKKLLDFSSTQAQQNYSITVECESSFLTLEMIVVESSTKSQQGDIVLRLFCVEKK